MSAAVAAAAAASAAISGYHNSSNSNTNNRDHRHHHHHHHQLPLTTEQVQVSVPLSRYESQKRRDWNTFGQYLKNHRPPLTLSRCSGAHVLEFLRYLDQFGKTKVHTETCAYFGNSHPPGPCPCPLKQAWGSLDALIGRLRAAFEENGGNPEINPFGARAVRLYLREVRDAQAKARGIAYEKKKRKKNVQQQQQQNGSTMMVVDDPVHDLTCSAALQYSSPSPFHNTHIAAAAAAAFVHLSNSDNGAPPRDASAVSYFSS